MCSSLLRLTLGPFCPQGRFLINAERGEAVPHTSLEGALPRLQVLRGLWHFHVGVKFFYLIEDCVLIIIFEIIITLL
jgi:hypothetical protein